MRKDRDPLFDPMPGDVVLLDVFKCEVKLRGRGGVHYETNGLGYRIRLRQWRLEFSKAKVIRKALDA